MKRTEIIVISNWIISSFHGTMREIFSIPAKELAMNIRIKSLFTVLLLLLPLNLFAGMPGTTTRGLISAQELHNLLQDNTTPSPVIIEVGWGGPEEYYDKGHIPGSIHVNTDEIEFDQFNARSTAEPKELGRSTTIEQDQAKGLSADATLPRNWWNIYPDQYLFPALANMGVNVDSSVILYAKDPTAAARLAWTMLYAGVRDIRILNGGLAAWQQEGFEISQTPVSRTPVDSFGTDTPVHPEYLVDIPFVRNAITSNNPDFVIVDIRTKLEYEGKAAPYSYIPTKGRVKNARWGKAGDGPWTMESYVNADGTFKQLTEIEQMWAENGITRDKHVAFYCGTAWRSSLAFYFAHMMGWERISNFDSSWYEWSMGPEAASNPIE
jgi:thiosulfate/3-mercaptopyruvate sulfurtransferase